MEVDFLKEACNELGIGIPENNVVKKEEKMSITKQRQLFGIPRSSYYHKPHNWGTDSHTHNWGTD